VSTPQPTYRLVTETGDVVASRVVVAERFGDRLRGLLGRESLGDGEGLCIQRSTGIHMFFMRFAIDVAFVDAEGRVLHLCHSIKPWRMSRLVLRSRAALELPAGTLQRHGVTAASVLRLEANT